MNLSPGTIAVFAVPLGIAAFVAFWCLICFIIARAGGWHALATRFPAGAQNPNGVQWFQWQSMELGASQYKGAVNVGIGPDGLYLSATALFKAGHAPICIPWSAMRGIKTDKRFWMTYYELSVPLEKFNTVTITLFSSGLANAIAPHLTPAAVPMR